MVEVAPRSTQIHCGSTPCVLSQRVPGLPSNAFPHGDSAEEAAHVLPCDRFGPPTGVGVAVGVGSGVTFGSVGTDCTANDALAPVRPGALALTVTVPAVNCVRSAIFVMPPSTESCGSPGAWYVFAPCELE